MPIKDLEVKQSNVDIILEVVDIGDIREFQKFGRAGRVATATVKDETGETKLTLWNDEIDKVKKGDKIHLINGYVNEWQGEMQLTTGRFGKLEVVGEGEETTDEATEETLLDDKQTDEGEHVLTEDEKEETDITDQPKSDKGEHILTKDEKKEAELLNEDIEEESVEEEVSDDEEIESK